MSSGIEYRPLTADEHDMHRDRLSRACEGRDFVLNTGDELDSWRVFNDLVAAEKHLLTLGDRKIDYHDGAAVSFDQIRISDMGEGTLLVSSEHATASWHIDRETGRKTPKKPEPGTAGLGYLIADNAGGAHMTLVGKQTGNANVEIDHAYQKQIRTIMLERQVEAFMSIHGMRAGLVANLEDERSYDIMLGIGDSPNQASRKMAEVLRVQGEQLGLRVGINQPFVVVVGSQGRFWQGVDKDGAPISNAFTASDRTTRAAAQRGIEELGKSGPTIQVELASSLRTTPELLMRDNSMRRIGPYLAYQALSRTVQIIT